MLHIGGRRVGICGFFGRLGRLLMGLSICGSWRTSIPLARGFFSLRKIEESNPTDFTLLPVFKTGCTPLCISSRKPNHHSHTVRELGVSLSLYQVTVLRVLHGICTHVAWLVENIKLSRIV